MNKTRQMLIACVVAATMLVSTACTYVPGQLAEQTRTAEAVGSAEETLEEAAEEAAEQTGSFLWLGVY